MNQPPRPGRPRSETARRAVLEAAAELFATDGFDATTMNAIIAKAGVGRQTVYRWWKSKHAVLMDVASEGMLGMQPMPDMGSCDPLERLESMVSRLVITADVPSNAALVRALAAAAAADSHDAEALYESTTRPVQEAISRTIADAQAAGQIAADADPDVAADAIIGIFLVRILTGRPTDEDTARSIVQLLTARR